MASIETCARSLDLTEERRKIVKTVPPISLRPWEHEQKVETIAYLPNVPYLSVAATTKLSSSIHTPSFSGKIATRGPNYSCQAVRSASMQWSTPLSIVSSPFTLL
jgi:hypothetical protein